MTNKSYSGTCGTSTADVNYSYDNTANGNKGKGKRTGMTDGSGSTTWVYGDNRGRLTKESKTIQGQLFVTQWAYDSGDQLTSMTYPDGEVVTYSYLPQMLVDRVGDGTYVDSTWYDAAGRVERRSLGNSQIRTDYNYYAWNNQGGRLQWVRSGTPNGSTVNATLQNLTYTYDKNGNVTTIVDALADGSQSQTFTYDNLDRLSGVSITGGDGRLYDQSYEYDSYGRISKGPEGNVHLGHYYVYGDSNHVHAVTEASVSSYGYDANGNMTSRIGFTYAYNAENRLVTVGGGYRDASFVYDGDGNRVRGTVDGIDTFYIGNYYELAEVTSTTTPQPTSTPQPTETSVPLTATPPLCNSSLDPVCPTETLVPPNTSIPTFTPTTGGCDLVPGNLLTNPGFESGTSDWTMTSAGSVAVTTDAPAYECTQAARVEINATGNNTQFIQKNLTLQANTEYRVRFAAYSSTGHDVRVRVMMQTAPGTNYGLSSVIDLTTGWQLVERTFTTSGFSGTVSDAKLQFWLTPFIANGDVYWFDAVELVQTGAGATATPTPTPNGPTATPTNTPVGPTPTPTSSSGCVPTNLVLNPGFESGTNDWTFFSDGGGNFTAATNGAYECTKAAKLQINNSGSNIQLYQSGITLAANTTYRFKVAAYSSSGNNMRVRLRQHTAPYTLYGLNEVFNLTTGWNHFDVTFTTTGFSGTTSDVRLQFWLSSHAAANDVYWLDAIELEQVTGGATPTNTPTSTPVGPTATPTNTPVGPTPTPTSSGGCIPTDLVLNPGFESGTNDWTFYTDSSGSFSASSASVYECTQAGRVQINSAGSNIQLYQSGITLAANTTYRFKMAAYSSSGNNMRVRLRQHTSPYTLYGLNEVLNLTTGWNHFDVTFTTTGFSGTTSDVRLQFWLSAHAAANDIYWFDAIELEQVTTASQAPARHGLAKALPAPAALSGTYIIRKYYYAGNTRVAMRSENGLQWLLSDHLGGTNITVNGTTEAGEIRYHPWGAERYSSGNTTTSFRYTGQRQELGLGIYYYGARWYDPVLGRFMQPDTIVPNPGDAQSFDRYAYVLNNPLKYTDPSGHNAAVFDSGPGGGGSLPPHMQTLYTALYQSFPDHPIAELYDGDLGQFTQDLSNAIEEVGGLGLIEYGAIAEHMANTLAERGVSTDGFMPLADGIFFYLNGQDINFAVAVAEVHEQQLAEQIAGMAMLPLKKGAQSIRGAVPGAGDSGGPTAGKSITSAQRQADLETNKAQNARGHYYCTSCGYENTNPSHFDIDHIVPKSQGGNTTSANRRVLCVGCNRSAQEGWPPRPGSDWATKYPNRDMRPY